MDFAWAKAGRIIFALGKGDGRGESFEGTGGSGKRGVGFGIETDVSNQKQMFRFGNGIFQIGNKCVVSETEHVFPE